MAIPIQQARPLFTQQMIATFNELQQIEAPSFLSGFFSERTSSSKSVKIEVRRGTEKLAVDVIRGTDGNANQMTKSTEKEFIPPFLKEWFDITQLENYDILFGQDNYVQGAIVGRLAQEVAEEYTILRQKMERTKEYYAAQVLETGILTFESGKDSIDFKRKAASMVNLDSTQYWGNTDADVEKCFTDAGDFIRQYGKYGGGTFNAIMSGEAWIALKKTDFFKNNANFNQVQLIDINMASKMPWGSVLKGRIEAGSYIFNIWVYDEFCENSSGVKTRYLDIQKMVIIPDGGYQFIYAHGGFPMIMRSPGNSEFSQYIQYAAGVYGFNNFIDPAATTHKFEIMSAPLPVPVDVDKIYTVQILGTENPVVE